VIIRDWTFVDNKEIELIEKASFQDPWSYDMLSSFSIQDNFIGLVCVENDEIAGYICASYVLDECEINIVATKEEYRQRGIGYALLCEFEKKAIDKNIEKIFLEVRRSNEKAQKLYTKCGFKYLGVREKYYGGKEDALIMSKVIK